MIGALVITKWAYGLIKETAFILLDGTIDKEVKQTIINSIEGDKDNIITDLHIWKISENHLAVTISIVTHYPQEPIYYKKLLSHIRSLSHIIVEVNECQGEPCKTT